MELAQIVLYVNIPTLRKSYLKKKRKSYLHLTQGINGQYSDLQKITILNSTIFNHFDHYHSAFKPANVNHIINNGFIRTEMILDRLKR